MKLRDKRVIVTGSSRGIGAAVLRECVREGASTVGVDIREQLGRAVAEEATSRGPGNASYVQCDVADSTSVRAAFEAAIAKLGGIDGLVHAAAIEDSVPAEELTEDAWDQVMSVNARGTMLVNQAVFEAMRLTSGSIVNFASVDGIRGRPGGAHYAASKGAVLAWTRTLADEWGRHGIRVNAVAPTADTPMMDEWRDRMGPESEPLLREFFAREIPLGGMPGDADRDIAPPVVFLLSDSSRFITGQTLPVDGGRCKIS